jgi:death-on-curing protein
MTEPIWLSVDLVVDIHSEQLALFGGPDGIRDRACSNRLWRAR